METDPPLTDPPTREELGSVLGPVVLEFGTSWCGYCRALAPQLAQLLARSPEVRHIKVEDGPGEPLGRSFGVKLWPTLVFLRDGQVVSQIARPSRQQAEVGLKAIVTANDSEAS